MQNCFFKLKEIDQSLKKTLDLLRDDKLLEELIKKIEDEKGIEFTIKNNEDIKIDYDIIPESSGLYLFKVFFPGESPKFNNWIHQIWLNIRSSPKLIKKNLKEYEKNVDLKDTWVYFYLGKRNNLRSRIQDHIILEKDKTTSSLKLNQRKLELSGIKFSVKWVEIKDKSERETILRTLEEEIRKKINPLIGKQ